MNEAGTGNEFTPAQIQLQNTVGRLVRRHEEYPELQNFHNVLETNKWNLEGLILEDQTRQGLVKRLNGFIAQSTEYYSNPEGEYQKVRQSLVNTNDKEERNYIKTKAIQSGRFGVETHLQDLDYSADILRQLVDQRLKANPELKDDPRIQSMIEKLERNRSFANQVRGELAELLEITPEKYPLATISRSSDELGVGNLELNPQLFSALKTARATYYADTRNTSPQHYEAMQNSLLQDWYQKNKDTVIKEMMGNIPPKKLLGNALNEYAGGDVDYIPSSLREMSLSELYKFLRVSQQITQVAQHTDPEKYAHFVRGYVQLRTLYETVNDSVIYDSMKLVGHTKGEFPGLLNADLIELVRDDEVIKEVKSFGIKNNCPPNQRPREASVLFDIAPLDLRLRQTATDFFNKIPTTSSLRNGSLVQNYYALLALPEDAPYQEIKKAMKKVQRRYHSDYYKELDTKVGSSINALMDQLNVLFSDRSKRQEYDLILRDLRNSKENYGTGQRMNIDHLFVEQKAEPLGWYSETGEKVSVPNSAGKSIQGRRKQPDDMNEDAIWVNGQGLDQDKKQLLLSHNINADLVLQSLEQTIASGKIRGVNIVCDGMGGVAGSEVISAAAPVLFIQNLVRVVRILPDGISHAEMINHLYRVVADTAEQLQQVRGDTNMVVSITAPNGEKYVISIGDANAYIIETQRGEWSTQLVTTNKVWEDMTTRKQEEINHFYLNQIQTATKTITSVPPVSKPSDVVTHPLGNASDGIKNIARDGANNAMAYANITIIPPLSENQRLLLCTDGRHKAFDPADPKVKAIDTRYQNLTAMPQGHDKWQEWLKAQGELFSLCLEGLPPDATQQQIIDYLVTQQAGEISQDNVSVVVEGSQPVGSQGQQVEIRHKAIVQADRYPHDIVNMQISKDHPRSVEKHTVYGAAVNLQDGLYVGENGKVVLTITDENDIANIVKHLHIMGDNATVVLCGLPNDKIPDALTKLKTKPGQRIMSSALQSDRLVDSVQRKIDSLDMGKFASELDPNKIHYDEPHLVMISGGLYGVIRTRAVDSAIPTQSQKADAFLVYKVAESGWNSKSYYIKPIGIWKGQLDEEVAIDLDSHINIQKFGKKSMWQQAVSKVRSR